MGRSFGLLLFAAAVCAHTPSPSYTFSHVVGVQVQPQQKTATKQHVSVPHFEIPYAPGVLEALARQNPQKYASLVPTKHTDVPTTAIKKKGFVKKLVSKKKVQTEKDTRFRQFAIKNRGAFGNTEQLIAFSPNLQTFYRQDQPQILFSTYQQPQPTDPNQLPWTYPSPQPQPGYPNPQQPSIQPGYPQPQPLPPQPQQPSVQPGYPPLQPQPVYPPQQPQQPQPQPGYPGSQQPSVQPGYPPQQPQPPQPGYPGSQQPSVQPGYPPQQPQPPQPQPGYPGSQQPSVQPGYPPQQPQPQPGDLGPLQPSVLPGYPPQQPQPGYPPQQPQPQPGDLGPLQPSVLPGYPPQEPQQPQPGYPPQQPQPQPGYPGSQQPPVQPVYPPQQPQPPQPQPGYPQQPEETLAPEPQEPSQPEEPSLPQPGYPGGTQPEEEGEGENEAQLEVSEPPEQGSNNENLGGSEETGENQTNGLCKAPRGQFASPTACNKFLNCWDDVAVEQECGGTLLFNEAAGYCDFPQNVDCGNRSLDRPDPMQPDGGCPSPFGTFRDSTNCGAFIVCVDAVPNQFICPGGLAYNDELAVCDYEYRVDCKGIPLLPPPEVPVSEQGENTIDGGENQGEVGVIQPGGEDLVIEEQPQPIPSPPASGGLPSAGYPSAPGLPRFPHSCREGMISRVAADCRAVAACIRGQTRLLTCPMGYAYDVHTNTCLPFFQARCF